VRRSCGAARAEIGGAAGDFGVVSVFGLSGVQHSLDEIGCSLSNALPRLMLVVADAVLVCARGVNAVPCGPVGCL